MSLAKFVEPMLASSGAGSFDDGWVFERKLDGLRCIAVREGKNVDLWSRNHLSFNKRFPVLIDALRALPAQSFVLDGEIVAFDEAGRSDFSLLQQSGDDRSAVFVAFDLVQLLGHDTTGLQLMEREALVEKTIEVGPNIAMVEHVEGEADALLADACRAGWEGLVAKRRDSLYKAGQSPSWRKLKCSASQEFVIGGWTAPKGARSGFGALLVGYYQPEGFRYAGKVGTGFSAATIASIATALEEREVPKSPFLEGEGEKGARWTEPTLVANVSFTEWTSDGRLRHPSFQGLRPDKAPNEVVRESNTSAPKKARS